MKTVLRYTAAGVALATFGFASQASAATGSAQVRAEILSTLQVAAVTGDTTLDFGQIADSGLTASSTVTVAPTGALTCGTNLTCSGTANAPTFDITGLAGSSVAISFPSSTATLNYAGVIPTGMTGQMTVSALTTSSTGMTLAAGAGVNTFTIGGTLTVNQLQAPGVYTGAVSVQVLYN
ncbi:MAG TPA: DUF4402 domain-containing protein [Croceibacterium sp.]